MARISRIVIPGIPHHVVQRGNRRQKTFFVDDDYQAYLNLLNVTCKTYGVSLLAYCLMPNHVHLIVIPQTQESLRLAIGGAHYSYTKRVNQRINWKGCLWQGRFYSTPMDDIYLGFFRQYVEYNPVRAGLCKTPKEYKWSSAYKGPDEKEANFLTEEVLKVIRRNSRTGRPLGSDEFITKLESELGKTLKPKKAGRKKNTSCVTELL